MELNIVKTVAVVGLSVMGGNLALNFASKGYRVIVYNRSAEKTKLLEGNVGVECVYSFKELSEAFGSQPKVLFLMVKAGEATDGTLLELEPFLEVGDFVIDLGNAHPYDSSRRHSRALASLAYHYAVCGISGGSEGARNGACLMFSGLNRELWLSSGLKEVLESVSAKSFDGSPTLAYLGQEVEGNYVKTIHNGIEYVQLQILSEVYHFLRLSGLPLDQISDFFSKQAELKKDYLLGVFALATADKRLDTIVSKIGSKGTGKWSTQLALEKDLVAILIPFAYNLRLLSESLPQLENTYSKVEKPEQIDLESLAELYDLGYQYALKEGLNLLKGLVIELDQNTVLKVWQGGCIIRNSLLLDLDPEFKVDHLRFHKLYHNLGFDKLAQAPLLAMIKEISELELAGLPQANTISLARNIFGGHDISLK
jgi:6-phosphogluconate dehydrogenase